MNSPYVRSALALKVLEFTPPIICDTLLEESNFRDEYGFTDNAVLSLEKSGISVKRSDLYNAVRKVLSSLSIGEVVDTDGQIWKLKDISGEGELPDLALYRGERRLRLPAYAALSPNKGTRLRFLDKASSEFNLPQRTSDYWGKIFSDRALNNHEVDAFYDEFRHAPIEKIQVIRSGFRSGQINIFSLVPFSRKYYERLVGEYDESDSIRKYATSSGRKIFDQLSRWRPYEGFLFSLFLSSHSSMAAEVNVDRLTSEDLVRAFDFLENYGDRISQIGAIEVGLRVLPSRPEIEQALIRLIEQIRDDDVSEQGSDFNVLTALFLLVDGELSRSRLLSEKPPFYRRLAALSQAALIQRQLVSVGVDTGEFSEWAYKNHGGNHYLQSLSDMRLEPHWDPNFSTALQMKDDAFGRIMILAKIYEQNIKGSRIFDLIFGEDAKSLISLSDTFRPWLHGPLEGTEDHQRILPPEVEEAIETQLNRDEIGPSSFIALVNYSLICRIGGDKAELAASALKRANYHLQSIENQSQLLAILKGLANVSAVSRSPTLADELRILARMYRRKAEYELPIEEEIKICLLAAASRSELTEWTEFVGDWLTELAFDDLKDEEAPVFHSWLDGLCHAVPELWATCGRADAALAALMRK